MATHDRVVETVAELRENWRTGVIIGGNVGTAAATQALAEAGADVVKVGIGPGAICTTRVVTGIGIPQWSAITNCAIEARRHGVGIWPTVECGSLATSQRPLVPVRTLS